MLPSGTCSNATALSLPINIKGQSRAIWVNAPDIQKAEASVPPSARPSATARSAGRDKESFSLMREGAIARA